MYISKSFLKLTFLYCTALCIMYKIEPARINAVGFTNVSTSSWSVFHVVQVQSPSEKIAMHLVMCRYIKILSFLFYIIIKLVWFRYNQVIRVHVYGHSNQAKTQKYTIKNSQCCAASRSTWSLSFLETAINLTLRMPSGNSHMEEEAL